MQKRQTSPLSGPGVMLLSAGIFGFFGFMLGFPEVDAQTGALIPLVVTLKWTLRATSGAFLATAFLTMASAVAGNALYAIAGLLSAVMFVVIAVWDMASTYQSGVHWLLLLVFAAWNGWTAASGLRSVMGLRGRAPAGELAA